MLICHKLRPLAANIVKSGGAITLSNKLHTQQQTSTSTNRRPNPGIHSGDTNKKDKQEPKKSDRITYYVASVAVGMFGLSFAAVPLYRIYCQKKGSSGQAVQDDEASNKVANMKKDLSRPVTIRFDSKTYSTMDWKFQPVQERVRVHPGETALAIYRVTNPLDELVIGVATYSVLPYEAGKYLNKIQCFCFDEQMLQPKEDVFMPVLFYLDPEFSKDPALASVEEVVLAYTFFRSTDEDYPELDAITDHRR